MCGGASIGSADAEVRPDLAVLVTESAAGLSAASPLVVFGSAAASVFAAASSIFSAAASAAVVSGPAVAVVSVSVAAVAASSFSASLLLSSRCELCGGLCGRLHVLVSRVRRD